MTEASEAEMLPCPFCGGGQSRLDENRMSLRMDGTSTLLSVYLRHWCAPGDDAFLRLTMDIRAHTAEDAIAAWNRRAGLPDEDDIEEAIADSIDLDWTPRDAAKAVMRLLANGAPRARAAGIGGGDEEQTRQREPGR